eukprot:CAMPEP_0185832708 /NCGR_PEP_ID=MMETSP1353-20130828/2241_1 /TAXON_ID=1077150 /ORGANISM="Erythrolobus australicus, Strain CCMP3124" /LENGTH=457 /DNA_ID=CAMNT_0028530915 /DNA_START=92 /DNA_END=1465 /DNA_ORIENTATION=-
MAVAVRRGEPSVLLVRLRWTRTGFRRLFRMLVGEEPLITSKSQRCTLAESRKQQAGDSVSEALIADGFASGSTTSNEEQRAQVWSPLKARHRDAQDNDDDDDDNDNDGDSDGDVCAGTKLSDVERLDVRNAPCSSSAGSRATSSTKGRGVEAREKKFECKAQKPSTGQEDRELAQMFAKSLSSLRKHRENRCGRISDISPRNKRMAERRRVDSDESRNAVFHPEDDITSTLRNCTIEELELFCSTFEKLWLHKGIPAAWKQTKLPHEEIQRIYADILVHEASSELELRKRAVFGTQDISSRHTWALPILEPARTPHHTHGGSRRMCEETLALVLREFNDSTYIPVSGTVPMFEQNGAPMSLFGSRRFQCYVVCVLDEVYLRHDCWETMSTTTKVARWFTRSELKRYWFPACVRNVFASVLPQIEVCVQSAAAQDALSAKNVSLRNISAPEDAAVVIR